MRVIKIIVLYNKRYFLVILSRSHLPWELNEGQIARRSCYIALTILFTIDRQASMTDKRLQRSNLKAMNL